MDPRPPAEIDTWRRLASTTQEQRMEAMVRGRAAAQSQAPRVPVGTQLEIREVTS